MHAQSTREGSSISQHRSIYKQPVYPWPWLAKQPARVPDDNSIPTRCITRRRSPSPQVVELLVSGPTCTGVQLYVSTSQPSKKECPKHASCASDADARRLAAALPTAVANHVDQRWRFYLAATGYRLTSTGVLGQAAPPLPSRRWPTMRARWALAPCRH